MVSLLLKNMFLCPWQTMSEITFKKLSLLGKCAIRDPTQFAILYDSAGLNYLSQICVKSYLLFP